MNDQGTRIQQSRRFAALVRAIQRRRLEHCAGAAFYFRFSADSKPDFPFIRYAPVSPVLCIADSTALRSLPESAVHRLLSNSFSRMDRRP